MQIKTKGGMAMGMELSDIQENNSMINNFLFNEKPARILIVMLDQRERTVSILSRNLELTLSHTIDTVNKYIEAGLVVREKKGRKQILTLTKRGNEIAELLSMAWRKVNYEL